MNTLIYDLKGKFDMNHFRANTSGLYNKINLQVNLFNSCGDSIETSVILLYEGPVKLRF